MDSLGVGAIEIRRIIAPNHHQHRQEAPKRYPAMPAWLLQWGALCSFQATPIAGGFQGAEVRVVVVGPRRCQALPVPLMPWGGRCRLYKLYVSLSPMWKHVSVLPRRWQGVDVVVAGVAINLAVCACC
jgi:hypothetical protein